MRQHRIGERTVTRVGCGDVRLATAAARNVSAGDVERAVHSALELGITLIDAAEEEAAERLCGDAVRALRLRDAVVVACRVPELAPRAGAPRRDVLPERLPLAHVQQRIEASLRATRLDVLPLAQLPLRATWRASSAWPELVGMCARLVREGKVLAWGALCAGDDADDPAELAELAAEPWLAALSIPYSLCERRAEALLAAAAAAAAAGSKAILARRPLAGGALAGTLGPGGRLALHDDRRSLDDRTLERIAVLVARLAPLVEREPPAARSCDAARAVLERGRRPPNVEAMTAAELALRFVIDRGAIALPRLHRAEWIPEAISAAAAPPLSPELLARLGAMLDEP
ncbi:MAG TPA: aldo/keto reductase [Kofleriaceae bacterium]|nr:aldo/keto reductase [Kofleriaceae bacterium]